MPRLVNQVPCPKFSSGIHLETAIGRNDSEGATNAILVDINGLSGSMRLSTGIPS